MILVKLKSETNRIWSEQELNEKAVWAFQHPHNEKERRKIRIDIADEIEEESTENMDIEIKQVAEMNIPNDIQELIA